MKELKEAVKERIKEKQKIYNEADIMIIEAEERLKLPDIVMNEKGHINTNPEFNNNTIMACQQIMKFAETQINELIWVLEQIGDEIGRASCRERV